MIAACVYVFGAMTQYTIGKLIDRHSLKAVTLPLSFLLAPFLYFAATLSNLPLILAAIGIVMGAFGQVTVNDAMVGKYTSEEWRSRAYAVRYFIGFTAAGVSVGLVAWLYQQGGFVTMLHAFAGLCLLVIAAAIILPPEIKVPAAPVRLSSGLEADASLVAPACSGSSNSCLTEFSFQTWCHGLRRSAIMLGEGPELMRADGSESFDVVVCPLPRFAGVILGISIMMAGSCTRRWLEG